VQFGTEVYGEGLLTPQEKMDFDEIWSRVDRTMERCKVHLLPQWTLNDVAECPLMQQLIKIKWQNNTGNISVRDLIASLAIIVGRTPEETERQYIECVEELMEMLGKYAQSPGEIAFSHALVRP